jgi:cation diffusion facilitator family transporter
LFDGISNLVGLAGLHIAGKPPDAEHPYGHRKFETVAALTIAILLFLTSWQLLLTAWERLRSGTSPEINSFVLAAMILSMLIQAGTAFYELRAGRRLRSEVLVADASHTRASILVSLSVLVGLLFVRLGFLQADAIVAALVALAIAKIGLDILRETLPVLVDQATIDPHVIAGVVSSVGGVESFHRVRSRGAQDSAAVDLHVRISPEKTMQEADAIANEVRRSLLSLEGVSDVTVHVEAQRDFKSNETDIFAALNHAAQELGLVIHESGLHRVDGNLFLEIHVGVDPFLTLGEAHELVDQLEVLMRTRLPEIKDVYTHIETSSERVEEGERVSDILEQEIRANIEQIVSGMPEIENPHNIVVRQVGNQDERLRIFLECTISPDIPLPDAHDLSTQIERELIDSFGGINEVFVHLEPPEQLVSDG